MGVAVSLTLVRGGGGAHWDLKILSREPNIGEFVLFVAKKTSEGYTVSKRLKKLPGLKGGFCELGGI